MRVVLRRHRADRDDSGLKYAAFAIELSGDAARLESGLLELHWRCEKQRSGQGTGRDIWRTKVKPHDPGIPLENETGPSRAAPIRIRIHQHQPVGNFGYVFEEHTRDVYLPLLKALVEREFFPIVMHVSGPLLEWLESSHSSYLDMVGELAAAGKIEMLLSGYYEPVLAALPRDDRVEQILWMRRRSSRALASTRTGCG